MRLSQLARKLALRPSEVVTFLSAYQITLEEGLNARLTDEQVEKVVRYFAPDRLSEIKAEPVKEEIKPEIKQEEAVLTVEEEQPEVVVPIIESVAVSQIAQAEEEKTDVIKVPKVELAGLKVLGKIELPEAKKKTTEQPGETEPSTEPLRPKREDRRKQNDRPRQQPPRSYKNPVTLEREQQEREAEEKRKEKAKREKDKKAEYYYSRVKAGAQPKPVRSIMEEHTEEVKERKPVPKGLWGRFMNWLNG